MSQNKERILLVEDEPAMRIAVQDALEGQGYRVLTANDGQSGLERALKEKPSLILLDVMLPKLNGFDVCAQLRRAGSSTPVLMLTAKGMVADRVSGLDAGADDYLVKPFDTVELLARIRAVLRRTQGKGQELKTLRLGGTEIDLVRQVASRGTRLLHLSAKEFAMLRLMAQTPGEPVARERFLDVVWGYTAFPTTRTVDNYIALLRSKLEEDPENPRWIQTVRGVGYRLDCGGSPSPLAGSTQLGG
jgi:DNA-binding response OmpR family regulator